MGGGGGGCIGGGGGGGGWDDGCVELLVLFGVGIAELPLLTVEGATIIPEVGVKRSLYIAKLFAVRCLLMYNGAPLTAVLAIELDFELYANEAAGGLTSAWKYG